jgi:glycosidase
MRDINHNEWVHVLATLRDGHGDFRGLAQRIDHLDRLNVTCLWLMPFKEKSRWTYDEQAGQYYLHRFYKHQPDLNVANRRCATRSPG